MGIGTAEEEGGHRGEGGDGRNGDLLLSQLILFMFSCSRRRNRPRFLPSFLPFQSRLGNPESSIDSVEAELVGWLA